MAYRVRSEEIDLSGFVTQNNDQIGGIVLKARKGGRTPKLTQGENQVLLRFGKPNSDYFGVFEAIEYCRQAPAYIVCALGSGYKYAGVDVKTTSVLPFGARSGRVFETFSNDSYSLVERNITYTHTSIADGKTSNFIGTITNSNLVLPIIGSSVKLYVGGNEIPVSVNTNTNVITSTASALTGTNTFNVASGTYDITFSGTIGSVATYTSQVSIPSTIDLSSGSVDKRINLKIDGTLYQNINLGQSASTTKQNIVDAINTAVGSTVASISTNFIKIDGKYASNTVGSISITAPTSGISALPIVFDTTLTSISVSNAVSPTGFVPKYGDTIIWDFNCNVDIKSDTSFSLFTSSPFDDTFESYSVKVSRVVGKQYRAILYLSGTQGLSEIKTYNFSLIKEKDSFGKSLYYEDVFREDEYLKIFVNTSYTNVADPNVSTVSLTGGNRGAEPQASDYVEAWNNFQKRNLYPVKNFMDIYGSSASTLKNLIENYQPYSFGITCVPLGNTRDSIIQFRKDLGIDFDGLALYCNWSKIVDTYNNSFSFTSNVGKIGVKYAQMNDAFDGLAPAGVDENGIGGQLSGFSVLEVENDFSETDLQLLDEAQINPIINDSSYGLMIYGDRTLQVTNSDTSFIGHRRLFNFMIDNITTQILRKQVFKLNDEFHRLLAKTQADSFIAPIFSSGLLRDVYVQCDEDNNTDEVLQVRKFILDVYVKVTPFSEFVLLRLTRLPQNAVVADFIQG